MGAAVSIAADISGSNQMSFTKEETRRIISQYAPVFREDIFDRHADADGNVTKEELLRLVDLEATYARNMAGQ